MKYLERNLNEKIKVCTVKTLKHWKEIFEETNKWSDIPFSWIKELILLECAYYPGPSINSLQYLSRFQWDLLTEVKKKKSLEIYMEPQKTLRSQRHFEKEQSRNFHTFWFKAIL